MKRYRRSRPPATIGRYWKVSELRSRICVPDTAQATPVDRMARYSISSACVTTRSAGLSSRSSPGSSAMPARMLLCSVTRWLWAREPRCMFIIMRAMTPPTMPSRTSEIISSTRVKPPRVLLDAMGMVTGTG
jgi:hypothetical protein